MIDTAADERDALLDVPNALGYERVFETNSNGYLVRQYLYSSLYDRMRYARLQCVPDVTDYWQHPSISGRD